ncbi:PREDICTED: uncharacterized protein LOC108663942 [Theobroma cacao]|uniref:Uncharacterized protein LOC108663942 n=1 Tax=Theobroma cacao TaxID=3641 RepID=A0AB32X3Z2_THECC|nr:PREDICTED: uncharacterized protein LOC108663942 [Theobroma cacao]
MKLQDHFLRKLEPIPTNSTDNRWKWFKNCLRALDGTYIKVKMPSEEKPRYRTRKGDITTNMLSEGLVTDGRVLRDAITIRHGLKVPHGFLAPVKGQMYHLNEWHQVHQPTTPKEFFNMKDTVAHNVTERCFRRKMTFDPIEDEVGECLHDNTTPEEEDAIGAINPTDAWTNWRMQLANEMFTECQTVR